MKLAKHKAEDVFVDTNKVDAQLADALVLAGGDGSALDPNQPIKGLVEIAGKPMLQWVLEALRAANNVREIVVVIPPNESDISSWEQLADHIVQSNGNFGENIAAGLDALRIPTIFITMISFMFRFTELFIEGLRSLQRAVASRAPGLSWAQRVLTYGRLGGNLFVRSYERGERVHDAMLARGYSGRLPVSVLAELRWRTSDTLALVFAVMMGLYYVLF